MLRKVTDYSSGTVSNALKELRQLGLIRESRDPEGRECIYELVVPLSNQLANYSEIMNRYFHEWNKFLEHLENELLKNHIAKKKGAEKIRHFIYKMRVIIPAAAEAMRRLQFITPDTP